MKQALTRLAFLTCAAIAGFAAGRIYKPNSSIIVPAYQSAEFGVNATDTGIKVTPMKFTKGERYYFP